MGQQLGALDGAILAQRDGEAEPGRIAVGRGLRQDQELLQRLEPFLEVAEVRLARLDETLDLVELGDTDRGLHVRELEVVARV